MLINVN